MSLGIEFLTGEFLGDTFNLQRFYTQIDLLLLHTVICKEKLTQALCNAGNIQGHFPLCWGIPIPVSANELQQLFQVALGRPLASQNRC